MTWFENTEPDFIEKLGQFFGMALSKPQMPQEKAVYFQTEQGSTYKMVGGSTVRFKTPHFGHDPKDQGVKQASDLTVFIDTEFAREIGMWQTSSAPKRRVLFNGDRLMLVSINYSGEWALDRIHATNTSFVTKPMLGLSPLELWHKDQLKSYVAYKGTHPGSKIVKISDQPMAPFDTM